MKLQLVILINISVKTKYKKYLLSDEIFQHRRFSCTLTADHSDLREVNRHMNAELGEGILHPIDDGDEGLHPLVSRHVDEINLLVLQ